jgi:transcriptional regulator with XRE-family HTH domain
MSFGEYLKRIRESKDMTISTLEKASDVSSAQLSRIENGKRDTPKPETIKKIAKGLDTDYSEMMRVAGYVVDEDLEPNHLKLADIKELSIKNEKSLEQIALKLAEETGEVSQALLSHLKANGSSYKGLTDQDVKEECVDVVIVALSLFYKLNGNDSEFTNLFDKKVEKWKQKVNENKDFEKGFEDLVDRYDQTLRNLED